MSYTLYIGENCHQCGDVISFLERKGIDFQKINVDKGGEMPPVRIFAFPALFEGEELISYGSDIKSYFIKKL